MRERGYIMFENISGKLKTLAKVITVAGVIVSVINGFVMMNQTALGGLLVMAIGSLLSWVSSFVIYGLGELVEQAERSNNNTYVISKQLEKMMKRNEEQ